MDRAEALGRIARANVGYFASVGLNGEPHIVPVTFALIESSLVHMVDFKPKTTMVLKRISNVERNPNATILVDHYEDEWERLWWVRIDGAVTVERSGPAWLAATDALAAKYPQYRSQRPTGAAIYLSIDRVTSWEYSG